MDFELIECANGLPLILSPMPGTPRLALAITFDGGVLREPLPGVARLAMRLLLKGTESRDAETLATELDERAIELRDYAFADCHMLVAIFLNRELPSVLDILEDVIFHSTFEDFEKERQRQIGEARAALDMPAEQAQDLLTRTMFPGHPYGNTGTRMLDTIAQVTRDSVRQWYLDSLNARRMNVTLVGDYDHDELARALEYTFTTLTPRPPVPAPALPVPPPADRVVTEARPDAHQAQVLQGWFAPPLGADDQAALSVMNTILGAAGLSSRLFLELRDKQGLAYTVRSAYTPMRDAGEFWLAIGTSPENIARARQGFTEQMRRLRDEPVSMEELCNAQGRLRGTYALAHETTSQQALDIAIKQINGLPPDYSERMLGRVAEVTVEDVQRIAQTFAAPSVTAVVARGDALPDA